MQSSQEQLHVIKSGIASLVPEADLIKKLDRKKALTIKLGVDPTSPDLHIGHAVPLRKLRQFQDLGHEVVLIIGDGTALIGDPSGRDSTRPQLSAAQIDANAQTYMAQAFKVLDEAKTRVVHNRDWIFDLDLAALLELLSNFTVARILERDDFSKRYHNQQSIAMHEFIYPIMQAYDSVVIKADVEIGGNDQLFNLLAGRELMEKKNMEPQVCLTLPLLEGLDGVRKMSKSYGNYVGLTEAPEEMFGKIMSIPDTLMPRYYRLATALSVQEIDEICAELETGSVDYNLYKRRLAREIISIYHGPDCAIQAEHAFDKVFKEHKQPENIKTLKVELKEDSEHGGVYLPGLLHELGLVASGGAGRRMIDQGGVKIEETSVEPKNYYVSAAELEGKVISVGRRKFVRLKA